MTVTPLAHFGPSVDLPFASEGGFSVSTTRFEPERTFLDSAISLRLLSMETLKEPRMSSGSERSS